MHHEPSVGLNSNNASGKSRDLWTTWSTTSSISDATSDNTVSWVFIGMGFLKLISSLLINFVLFVAKNMDNNLRCGYGSDAGCWFLDTRF
jgi:hypothetical protein